MSFKSVTKRGVQKQSTNESPIRPLHKWPEYLAWAAAMLATFALLMTAYGKDLTAMVRWPAQQAMFLTMNQAFAALPSMFWSAVTLMGDATVLMLLLALFLLRKPQVWAAAIAAAPLGGLFSVSIKHWAAAPRPAAVLDHSIFNLIGPALYSNSFPSGHTITAFAAASAVVLTLTTRQTRHTRGSWIIFTLGIVLASLVGLSRIAVGAHWPIDILAGAAGGWLAGISGAVIARHTTWWRWLFFGAGRRSTAIGLVLWGLLLWVQPHSSLASVVVLAITGLCGVAIGLWLLMANSHTPYEC